MLLRVNNCARANDGAKIRVSTPAKQPFTIELVLQKRTADRDLKKLCGLGMNDDSAVRRQESAIPPRSGSNQAFINPPLSSRYAWPLHSLKDEPDYVYIVVRLKLHNLARLNPSSETVQSLGQLFLPLGVRSVSSLREQPQCQ